MKVLLSAYACEPGRGSEPEVGWGVATHLAAVHEVWVLTRANNRQAIEAGLTERPVPGLHFVYHDWPKWLLWWKRGVRGSQLYYYLWQLTAAGAAMQAHRTVGFDVAHHVTFAKYWSPSFLAVLPVPYVWGPLGGGDSTPRAFLKHLTTRGRIYERARMGARWLAERDPRVRRTASRSSIAYAATEATARRLRALGATDVRVLSQVALSNDDLARLHPTTAQPDEQGPLLFLSIGRLLDLKATELGVRAFAAASLRDASFRVIGDGPDRPRLQRLAHELGVADRVAFTGWLTRSAVLEHLRSATALVHPSLHDSGGLVCAEALAGGVPVICLDLAGPAMLVTGECGVVVPATSPGRAVTAMAAAMRSVSAPDVRREKGKAALARATHLGYEQQCGRFTAGYEDALRRRAHAQ